MKTANGYYWNRETWELHTVNGETPLPEGRFVRVPTPALFVIAPVMGGLFAVFLPFIGFAMTFYGAGKKAAELLGRRAKTAEARR
jgi:hypothetical protein